MQIILKFKLNETFSVKFNYNHQLQGAIYAKLKEAGVSDSLHGNAANPFNTYKGFIFSPLKGEYKISDNQLHFNESVSVEFRSVNFPLCDAIQRSFEINPAITLFGRNLFLENMDISNKHINQNECLFAATSPVIASDDAEDGKTVFYSPGEDRFIELLNINFHNKYAALSGKMPKKPVIAPIGHHRKVVTKYKGIWLNGYIGKYKISAESRFLEFMYNSGLGKRSSQGFGFLELV